MNHEMILTIHRDKAIDAISERLTGLMKQDAEIADTLASERDLADVGNETSAMIVQFIQLYYECIELVALHDSILPAQERDSGAGR